MVDERMRAAWGRRYTQQDTADYIERSTQVLAKKGNPDSSVVNADKAEEPGTVKMSGEVAHPEELVMPPEETRAGIEEHVRRLAPPAEFLQRGKELIGTQGRGGLRWPGQRSFCKVVGQSLGGLDASGAWRWLEADRDARAIVASRFVEEHRAGVTETRLAYVAGADQLLDRADRSAGGCCGQWQTSSTRTQRSRKMYTMIRPRAKIISARVGPGTSTSRPAPAFAKHPDVRPPLVWRPVPGTCGAQTIRATWCG